MGVWSSPVADRAVTAPRYGRYQLNWRAGVITVIVTLICYLLNLPKR